MIKYKKVEVNKDLKLHSQYFTVLFQLITQTSLLDSDRNSFLSLEDLSEGSIDNLQLNEATTGL